MAIPTLASTRKVMDSSLTGSASATLSREATSRAAAASLTDGRSTANSSPPSRATTSPGRTLWVSRCATALSRRSPTACPSVSLTCLSPVDLSRSISRNPAFVSAMVALHGHRGAEVDRGEREEEQRDDHRRIRGYRDRDQRRGRQQHDGHARLVGQVRLDYPDERRPGAERDRAEHHAEIDDEVHDSGQREQCKSWSVHWYPRVRRPRGDA